MSNYNMPTGSREPLDAIAKGIARDGESDIRLALDEAYAVGYRHAAAAALHEAKRTASRLKVTERLRILIESAKDLPYLRPNVERP